MNNKLECICGYKFIAGQNKRFMILQADITSYPCGTVQLAVCPECQTVKAILPQWYEEKLKEGEK